MREGGGKGDKQRPLSVPKEQFDSNWDAIFKKPVKTYAGGKPHYVTDDPLLEELRKSALNPDLRTYDGKLK